MSCYKHKQSDYQPFPVSGSLKKNSNLSLNYLKSLKRLKKAANREDATVYCYIIKTVKNKDNFFQQTGCGPNWQGGLITLCTCKHYMRTFLSPEDWKGKWIAGFTSINDGSSSKDGGNRRNALVYLMKVKKAFASHYELWHELPNKTRAAKDVHENIHGDVFHPKDKQENSDKYAHSLYCGPCELHDHFDSEEWHKDVKYFSNHTRRHASLLVGDENNSFLWTQPFIVAKEMFYGRQKTMPIDDLFNSFLV
jgi:hypothetical protein